MGDLALHQRALALVPDLVIGVDRQGDIQFVNRAAEAITGYAGRELVGTRFVALLPEDLQAGCARHLAGLVGETLSEQAELSVIRTRAGALRDVAWRLHRLAHEVGAGVVILVVGSDVTDTRLAAQRVQREQQLRAISTLAAGLAHEIRNPLNAAQLHVALLKRLLASQQAHPEALEAVHVVGDEIRRLAQLVSEFLAFAEPGALVKAPSVMQAVIARAVAAADVPPGIAIAVAAPPDDLVIVADGARIERVIRHLVDNAIDAIARAGAGEISVRVRREPRAIVIEVEDDGPGLPSPDAPVFDAFFSTKPSGAGLGLAISHRIVTDHGGTIDVESRPGRTCFRVVLPLDGGPRASQPGPA